MALKYKFNDEAPLTPGADATPPASKRKSKGTSKMEREELSRIMRSLITDAQSLAIDELADARTTATSYYNGDLFGTEEDGRSQVVVTEVRDQILGMKPSLMRLFFAPESPVEFMPLTEQGVPGAKQTTDYIHFAFQHQSNGWRVVNDLLDDGLIRRLGIVKWSWEPGDVQVMSDENLTSDELFELVSREDVTPTSITSNGQDGDAARFAVEYSVQMPGRVAAYAIPPEEWIFDRDATSVEDATMVGHAREMTKGDLLALGVSQADLDAYGGTDSALEFSADKVQRNENTSPQVGHNNDAGEANDKVLYIETYTKVDVDGDNKAELRRICTIGPTFHIVHNEPALLRPFAIFAPIPEAHAMIGFGEADLLMDLQYVKSHIVRGVLDSFALSIFPRMAFIEGAVSAEDILNTEIGAPIRTREPDAVQSFSHPFTGQNAMPLLEYFDQMAESRTGRDKGSSGLDADALQSSTPGAVQAALSATQERTEFLARQFAEQTLKPLFYGMYRLMVEHKDELQTTLVKLRGEYVPIDIASWEADYQCIVNVALGVSLPEQRIERLLAIAGKQEQIFQAGGPENPLVGPAELRHTYGRILELSGERDVSSYFKPIPPNYTPPPAPPTPPSPEHELAMAQVEVERMRVMKEVTIKEAELELKRQAQEFEQNFEIAKLAQESTLKRYAIDAQWAAGFTQKNLELDASAEEAAVRAALDARKQQHAENTLAAQDQQHQERLAAEQSARDQDQAHERDIQTQDQLHEQDMADKAAQQTADTPEAE